MSNSNCSNHINKSKCDEEILKYRKNEDIELRDTAKIYFCAHPEDYKWMFDEIAEDILAIYRRASVWYYDPFENIPDVDDLMFALSQMQLFVVPVSSDFLNEENQARCIEFEYAINNNIPILPLLQERGVEGDFNRICGDYQIVDKYGSDDTQIAYDEKIRKQMNSIFVNHNELDEILSAFDARIFLSYRKKDRKFAQRIMEKIHSFEKFRGVSIWYDEFLVPGENFNSGIGNALDSCDLCVLSTTESLLEMPNYINDIELPNAIKGNKKLLAISDGETDTTAIKVNYPGIGEIVDINDDEKILQMLSDAFAGFEFEILTENPHKEYLMAIAYLSGTGVEINRDMGIELLMDAANRNEMVACDKLAFFYEKGLIVKLDRYESIKWRKRAVAILEEIIRKNPDDDENLSVLMMELGFLSGILAQMNFYEEAKEISKKISYYGKMQKKTSGAANFVGMANALQMAIIANEEGRYENAYMMAKELQTLAMKQNNNLVVSSCFEIMGKAFLGMEKYDQAEKVLTMGVMFHNAVRTGIDNAIFGRNLIFIFVYLSEIKIHQRKYEESLHYVDKAYEEYQTMEKKGYIELEDIKSLILLICDRYAPLYSSKGDFINAYKWRKRALDYSIELYEEDNTPSTRAILANSYFKMALVNKMNGNSEEQISNLEKSLELFSSVKAERENTDKKYVDSRYFLETVRSELVAAYMNMNRIDEAEKTNDEICEGLMSANNVILNGSLCDRYLGAIKFYYRISAFDKAEKCLHSIIPILEENDNDNRKNIVNSYLPVLCNLYGDILRKQNRDMEASEWYIKGMKYEKTDDTDDFD